MAKEAPYTVTVYVAAPGTPLKNGGTSAAGHMYLSVSHEGETRSFGFAPAVQGARSGPGEVTGGDVSNYGNPFYARTMEISREQYDKIIAYGSESQKHGFSQEYNGLSNSCIDFTWGALNQAGIHRQTRSQEDTTFEGALKPLDNKREIKSIQAPFPESKLNVEIDHPMPKRTFQQWLISENEPMLEQIQGKVAELDAASGRSFDSTSERISASLLVLAKENGLSRVDHVVLSDRTANAPAAENIFVVQGERGDPAHLRAAMPTAVAAQTPVEASLERSEQLANAHQLSQQQLVAQNEQSQTQEREAAVLRMG